MDNESKNLWQGGLWEQEKPQYPMPPPVVVPPPRKFPERAGKEMATQGVGMKAKLGFGGLLALIFSLVLLSVALGTSKQQGFQLEIPTLPNIFGESETPRIFIDPMENVNLPPTIRSEALNENVEVHFLTPSTGEALTSREIYTKCLPSIVFIESESFRQYATGTGVIMSEDGYIITNAHVIEGASKATVTLHDNRQYDATMVDYSFEQDLAVLKIEATDLVAAEFVDSDTLMVGDASYAMGNPLGSEYRSTFTDGMVSAVNRQLKVDGGSLLFVQTTAAINSGNSGGALINEYGQVVGITTIKIMSEEDTIEGMGFAIPSKRVKVVVDRLMSGEEMLPAMIGITVAQVTEPTVGVLVASVVKGTNIEKEGMVRGDIILEANGTPVATISDLNAVKGYLFAGDVIDYLVYRDGEEIMISASLETQDVAS